MTYYQLSLPIEEFLSEEVREQRRWESSLEGQFIHALHSGDIPRIKALWLQDIDFQKLRYEGFSPLECAVEWGNVEVVKTLLQLGFDMYQGLFYAPLEEAINRNRVDIVSAFIEAGINVNADLWSESGCWMPLMCAANIGHVEIAKLLIDKGASLNTIDEKGWTALIYATYRDHFEPVKLLIESGADADVITSEGLTAFDYAIELGHTEIFKYLF